MTTNKQKLRLTESQLRQMIAECVNEAMQDEGFFSGMKQLGGWAGRGVANAAQGVGQKVKGAWNAGKDAAGRMAANAKQQYQMGSQKGDNQKIVNQLEQWIKQGVFANPRAKSLASQLVNMLEAGYQQQFGQESGIQNNFRR